MVWSWTRWSGLGGLVVWFWSRCSVLGQGGLGDLDDLWSGISGLGAPGSFGLVVLV